VLDILSNTSAGLDQVTIEPDGQWKVQGSQSKPKETAPSFSVIDDLEVSEFKPRVNNNTPARSTVSAGTPSMVESRESTALPRGVGTTSAKRPAPVVIDLTLDSDDEDAAPPPAKRQQLNNSTHQGSNYYPSYY
jgi:E3 SUMO-protein ligase PIAS1